MTRFGTVRVGLVALLATATVGLGAMPASAHTALKSSNPKANAEVAPPTDITLTYTETVRLPRVILTGPDGARKESGTPKAVGDTVTQRVNGTLPNGTYTVGWRVVSADGHPVAGTYKFTVKGSAPESPGSASTPSSRTASSPAASQGSSGSSSGWLWIGLAALVVVLVVGGIAWARRPGQD